MQHRQIQRSVRQRYASSIKRHRLGVIQEEEEEPQEEMNSNGDSVNALSEVVVIENDRPIAKDTGKVLKNRRGDIEMRSPNKSGQIRSLDRTATNKLEVSHICIFIAFNFTLGNEKVFIIFLWKATFSFDIDWVIDIGYAMSDRHRLRYVICFRRPAPFSSACTETLSKLSSE